MDDVRRKQNIARKIRQNILDAPASYQQLGKELSENIGITQSITTLTATLETISAQEASVFEKLLDTLQDIPLTNREIAIQERKVFNALVDTLATLDARLESLPEGEAGDSVRQHIHALREKAHETYAKLDYAPRGLRESIGAGMGFSPVDVRQKGLFRTVMDEYREVTRPSPMASLEDIISARKDSLSMTEGRSSYAPLSVDMGDGPSVEAMSADNSKAMADLRLTLHQILVEASLIRKIVEGSIKYDPTFKRNKYREAVVETHPTTQELILKWKHLEDTMHFASTPGAGLGKHFPNTMADLPNYVGSPHMGIDSVDEFNNNTKPASSIFDYTTNPILTVGPNYGIDTNDEFNENTNRDNATNPPIASVAAMSSTIGQQLEANAITMPIEGSAPAPSSPGMGGILGSIGALAAGKGMANVLRRSGAQAARTTGAKAGAKVLGKTALKSFVKKIPMLGLIAGLGFGAHRLFQGDGVGALGEVASGAASLLPGVGTAASLGIDGMLMGRDMQRAGVEGVTPTDTETMLQDSVTQQPPSLSPTIIENKTFNTYTTQSRGAGEIVPSIRTTDTSFMRFQDRRMSRIL